MTSNTKLHFSAGAQQEIDNILQHALDVGGSKISPVLTSGNHCVMNISRRGKLDQVNDPSLRFRISSQY